MKPTRCPHCNVGMEIYTVGSHGASNADMNGAFVRGCPRCGFGRVIYRRLSPADRAFTAAHGFNVRRVLQEAP